MSSLFMNLYAYRYVASQRDYIIIFASSNNCAPNLSVAKLWLGLKLQFNKFIFVNEQPLHLCHTTIDRKFFIVKNFRGCPKPRKFYARKLFYNKKNTTCGALRVVSDWQWLFFDTLKREMGFWITLAYHFFTGYIHSESRSDKSDDWWQKVCAIQKVQPGGAVSDRSLELPQKWTKMFR